MTQDQFDRAKQILYELSTLRSQHDFVTDELKRCETKTWQPSQAPIYVKVLGKWDECEKRFTATDYPPFDLAHQAYVAHIKSLAPLFAKNIEYLETEFNAL